MSLSSLVIRLIFLAFPGVVAYKLYKRLRGRSPKRQWEDVLDIAIFSVASYLLLMLISTICNYGMSTLFRGKTSTSITQPWATSIDNAAETTFAPFLDETKKLSWTQILLAALCAIPIAYGSSRVPKLRWINRFGQWSGCTLRYGDEDLWEFFHEGQGYGKWLYVRDHKLDLLYYGAVENFSETEKTRELILANVSVFRNDCPTAPLYFTEKMYLVRRRDDITIERPEFTREKVGSNRVAEEVKHDEGQHSPPATETNLQ
jgi:hypothetical protein